MNVAHPAFPHGTAGGRNRQVAAPASRARWGDGANRIAPFRWRRRRYPRRTHDVGTSPVPLPPPPPLLCTEVAGLISAFCAELRRPNFLPGFSRRFPGRLAKGRETALFAMAFWSLFSTMEEGVFAFLVMVLRSKIVDSLEPSVARVFAVHSWSFFESPRPVSPAPPPPLGAVDLVPVVFESKRVCFTSPAGFPLRPGGRRNAVEDANVSSSSSPFFEAPTPAAAAAAAEASSSLVTVPSVFRVVAGGWR